MTYITIKREVLEQAIEALITRNPLLCEDAITALRTALEAKDVEPVAYMQGTALYWPDDAEVGEPDCQPLFRHPAPDARLVDAAQAVVDRWDTPSWKDVPATAEYINALRNALEGVE
jgi:hypothetical protein